MSTEKTVLVDLKSSVEVGGTMYHPNSQGVKMPAKHAKAIGATIKEEVKETTSKKGGDKKTSEKKDSKDSETEVKQVADLPVDDDILEKLLADERFTTLEALVENQDQLTDVKGIGPATAKTIVEALG